MPELPEVETIRRDLASRIVKDKVTAVEIRDTKTVKNTALSFRSLVAGKKVVNIDRKGKLLALELDSGKYILVHLKMTGQLIWKSKHKIVAGGHSFNDSACNFSERFTRLVLTFSSGGKLYFNDMRRFGYVKVVTKEEKEKVFVHNFGPEPLTKEFTSEAFGKLFIKRTTNIKALLLNQKLIAGLGNIYVDETLFAAGIRPTRRANTLTKLEIAKLYREINRIIALAIKHRGTTFYSFVDCEGEKGSFVHLLKVYDRAGEKCVKCGGTVSKTRVAGRGTHYCPKCQR